MKPFLIAILSLCLIQPMVEAKGKGGKGGKEAAAKKEAAQKAKDEKTAALQAALTAKDKNHDGSLSLDEYLAGESDAASATAKFDKFNKNKDRMLSKQELADSLGL